MTATARGHASIQGMLCSLPSAQGFSSSTLQSLLQLALNNDTSSNSNSSSSSSSSSSDWEQEEAEEKASAALSVQSISRLFPAAGATLDTAAVEQLLIQAVKQQHTEGVIYFTGMPAAQQLDDAAVAAVLEAAVETEGDDSE